MCLTHCYCFKQTSLHLRRRQPGRSATVKFLQTNHLILLNQLPTAQTNRQWIQRMFQSVGFNLKSRLQTNWTLLSSHRDCMVNHWRGCVGPLLSLQPVIDFNQSKPEWRQPAIGHLLPVKGQSDTSSPLPPSLNPSDYWPNLQSCTWNRWTSWYSGGDEINVMVYTLESWLSLEVIVNLIVYFFEPWSAWWSKDCFEFVCESRFKWQSTALSIVPPFWVLVCSVVSLYEAVVRLSTYFVSWVLVCSAVVSFQYWFFSSRVLIC